jgi:hypothetical protein
LAAQSKTTLNKCQYNASTDLFTSPLGWYHVNFAGWLFRVSDSNLVYGKKFYLRAKIQNKAIDGYEDLLKFSDSNIY